MRFIKIVLYLLYFLAQAGNAQDMNLKLIDSLAIPNNEYTKFIGVDTHNFLFFTKHEIVTKTDGTNKWVYTNYELGEPTSVSILNPLQILIFYKETNTLVFLDRFLNETQRIDLNSISPSKIILWAENTKNQEAWLHNEITNSLEFYNYKNNSTRSQTIPFSEKPSCLTADFSTAYVLFDSQLCSYNIYGTQLNCAPSKKMDKIVLAANYIVGSTPNKSEFLFFDTTLKTVGSSIILQNNWQDFSVRNEKLYIYNGSNVYTYQLILSSK
ncbi:hypothetical protein [Aquimarina agarilytica]|uniref:hypothetical protein n=1 Tax=Aquimarina agarilytica TaxID=1087449 RepID=UPI000288F2ED|nr:hypothetical protein [Aquimarina agarilytica]